MHHLLLSGSLVLEAHACHVDRAYLSSENLCLSGLLLMDVIQIGTSSVRMRRNQSVISTSAIIISFQQFHDNRLILDIQTCVLCIYGCLVNDLKQMVVFAHSGCHVGA